MSWEATTLAHKVAETGVLTTGEILVLLLLANHADEDWTCFPSQERLARSSNQGLRTVERQIKHFKELGVVSAEKRYGEGRGQIGLRYRLHEHVMEQIVAQGRGAQGDGGYGTSRLPENRGIKRPATVAGKSGNRGNTRPATLAGESGNREIMRPANLAGESGNREITRPANLAGKSENGGNTRPATVAGETTHPPMTTDSPANDDIRPYKDRARTNHQEPSVSQSVRLSGAVRATEVDGRIDDGSTTDQPGVGVAAQLSASPSTAPGVGEPVESRVHRGVDLDALTERVPAAAELDEAQLRLIVQVVLARASGPVRNPLAFVATSMTREFHELVAITAQHVPAPRVEAPETGGGQVRQFPAREPVPCTNPDHAGYGSDVLADCPHCRIEAKATVVAREARG